mmetsp:Transcript_118217/g.334144  ORF Transcript_118217/g.334144 Transcript_118217/m.334144 type:complete len:205 (+) Transcript_118217:122-736(+)
MRSSFKISPSTCKTLEPTRLSCHFVVARRFRALIAAIETVSVSGEASPFPALSFSFFDFSAELTLRNLTSRILVGPRGSRCTGVPVSPVELLCAVVELVVVEEVVFDMVEVVLVEDDCVDCTLLTVPLPALWESCVKAFLKFDLSVKDGTRGRVRGVGPGEFDPVGDVTPRGELVCEPDSRGEAIGLLLPIAAIPCLFPVNAGL